MSDFTPKYNSVTDSVDYYAPSITNGTYYLPNLKCVKCEATTISNLSHTTLLDIGTNTHDQIDNHIISKSVHGVTGEVVGTTDAQLITNKTINGLDNIIFNINHDNLANRGSNTHNQIDLHILSTTAHGVTGNIVGTNDSQTLSNKTISGLNNNIININHIDLLNKGTNTHAQIDTHISSSSAHGVTSPIVGVADSQTISNKAFTSTCTYLNPINNTFTPATYLVKDNGSGVQSIGRVDGIASTMLSDSNNIVRSLTSPTFTNVTANDIISNSGYVRVNVPNTPVNVAEVDFQVASATKLTVACDNTSPFNSYIQATGDLNISSGNGTGYLTLAAAGIPVSTGAIGSLNVLCNDALDPTIRRRNNLVDTTSSQTLSSKSLTAPTLTGTTVVSGTIQLAYANVATNNSTVDILAITNGNVVVKRTNIVDDSSTQTLNNKTLATNAVANTPFIIRATNQYNIAAVNPAANRTYSLQDVGVDSNFLMTPGLVFNATLNQGVVPTIGYNTRFWRGTSSTTGGVATFNITNEGTAGGTAIFSSLTTATIQATAVNNTSSAISVPLCSIKSVSSTQVLINVVVGVTAVLAANTLTFAPNGTVVQLLICGN